MSELDPILETMYRRAGLPVTESAAVAPVDPPAGVESSKPLTEAEIQKFALARAGIVSNEK